MLQALSQSFMGNTDPGIFPQPQKVLISLLHPQKQFQLFVTLRRLTPILNSRSSLILFLALHQFNTLFPSVNPSGGSCWSPQGPGCTSPAEVQPVLWPRAKPFAQRENADTLFSKREMVKDTKNNCQVAFVSQNAQIQIGNLPNQSTLKGSRDTRVSLC